MISTKIKPRNDVFEQFAMRHQGAFLVAPLLEGQGRESPLDCARPLPILRDITAPLAGTGCPAMHDRSFFGLSSVLWIIAWPPWRIWCLAPNGLDFRDSRRYCTLVRRGL